jgi:hypothetical protein
VSDNAAPPPAEQTRSSDLTEKPACFYLGREYDLSTRTVVPGPAGIVEYDARNLTTHGVIIGMTGSGKTGLSIALLEEAAIDAIPAVIIDPKGDLTNLLLQFPDLAPAEFRKWLNPEDARQKQLTEEQYAQELSQRWLKGLAESDQTPDRIKYLRQAVDYRIYTPGSEAGLPVSLLGRDSDAGKSAADRGSGDSLSEDVIYKINARATALLGLSGIEADPITSREHVLIATLLTNAAKGGKTLDLPGLIREIQNPPISTVGAYNLETFFPAKDRLKFASQLNNVLASPVFETWTRGEPLDIGSMLYRNSRPQHLIFYLAHLDDSQRMFFVTLLLAEMLSWTRRQSGTTNLRALLYFDEVFGYLPPHPGNPPSKAPLLTLLKQARAFGVGVLLATQNPVDLDYKALSNAGTWFVGKLQTERDKARLLDGLESVAAEYGTLTDRNYLEKVIASLGNRVFLLHNINQGKPKLFQSKWCLSFLRGPLSREEIRKLMKPVKEQDSLGAVAARPLCPHCFQELPPGIADRCPACGKNPWAKSAAAPAVAAPVASVVSAGGTPVKAPAAAPVGGSMRYNQPVLPPDVNQFYLPVAGSKPGHELEYQPWVLGFAEVVFQVDKRTGLEHRLPIRLLARAPEVGHPVDWDRAMPLGIDPATRPQDRACWAAVPSSLDTGRKLKVLEKAFGEYLYGTQKVSLFENRELELVSLPGEVLEAFKARCVKRAQTERDQALELERVKFAPKIEAAEQSTGKGKEDRVARIKADLQARLDEITEKYRLIADEVVPIQIKPRKVDIRVSHFGLAWAPFWRPVGRA